MKINNTNKTREGKNRINIRNIFLVLFPMFFIGFVQATDLSFSPASQQVNVGVNFEVNVSISDVIELYSFQFDMTYNSSVLEYVGISLGPFLNSDGASVFELPPNSATLGFLDNYAATRVAVSSGVSGSGVIAKLIFRGLNPGTSNLVLLNDLLYDSNSTDPKQITHTKQIGVVNVIQGSVCSNLDGDGYDNCTLSDLGDDGFQADCNDTNSAVNPGATEICNGVDDNCAAGIDEGVQNTYYQDVDSDNYGNPVITTLSCSAPLGYVIDNTDCNDADPNVNPGEIEFCNGVDDNCALGVDEAGVCSTDDYYCDADSDTYNSSIPSGSCTGFNCIPLGCTSVQGNDCNDGNNLTNPGAVEVCDGIDNNCVAGIDEGVQNTYYLDLDTDTYGNPSVLTLACTVPIGYVSNGNDCNDNDLAINPVAIEICDGIDNNCALGVDEAGVCSTDNYYCDSDSDSYDSMLVSGTCSGFNCIPLGCTSVPGNDCNDNNATINPGETEICGNGIDEDCTLGDLACPLLCTITNMYWNTTSAQEDDVVELTVEGSSGCDGLSVSFVIFDKDGLLGGVVDELLGGADDPVLANPPSRIFSSGSVQTTWQTEWQDDGFFGITGDPDYYFVALIDGTPYDSSLYSGLLNVALSNQKWNLMSIHFDAGKNSFSLPLFLENYSIDYVFRDIRSSTDRIYTYDNGFKVYNFNGLPSNLYDLQVGKGYMVFMNSPADLIINGSRRDTSLQRQNITLVPGWNFIGTFSNSYQAQDILRGISNYELYTYNRVLSQYELVSANDYLEGDRGYWIKVNQGGTFIPLTGTVIGNE